MPAARKRSRQLPCGLAPKLSWGRADHAYPARVLTSGLATDRRWVVHQKIAWTANRVIRVSRLSGGRASDTGTRVPTISPVRMRQSMTVAAATTLPTRLAWTTAQRTIAVIALSARCATIASHQGHHQSQNHQCALHLRLPLRYRPTIHPGEYYPPRRLCRVGSCQDHSAADSELSWAKCTVVFAAMIGTIDSSTTLQANLSP